MIPALLADGADPMQMSKVFRNCTLLLYCTPIILIIITEKNKTNYIDQHCSKMKDPQIKRIQKENESKSTQCWFELLVPSQASSQD